MTTVNTSLASYWSLTTTKQFQNTSEMQHGVLKIKERIASCTAKTATISSNQLADRIDSFRYRVQYLKHMEFYKARWISQAPSQNAQGSALLDGHFLVNQYFNEKGIIFSTKEQEGGIKVLNQSNGMQVCISSELPDLIRKNNYFGSDSEGVPQALIEALELQASVDYAPKIKKLDSWVPAWKYSTKQAFEEAHTMAEQHCISKISIHNIITAYELPYSGYKSQAKFLNQSLTNGELQTKEYLGDSPTSDKVQEVMDYLIADLQELFFNKAPKAANKEEAEAILNQPCWDEKQKTKRFLHLFVPGGDRDEPANTAPLMIAEAELEQLHWEDKKDKIHIYKRVTVERICLEEDDHIIS